jgi:hypothetical protein
MTGSIIWPYPVPETSDGPATDEVSPSAWWEALIERIGSTDQKRTDNLWASSSDILGQLPDPANWGVSPSSFNGLVVGAVQSGKTESMIGVSALAIEAGYRMIFILTGNNEDLRRQTALRFNTQLLGQSDRKPGPNNVWTIAGRKNSGPLGGYAPPYDQDTTVNRKLGALIGKYLRAHEPIVVTVKKDVANLEALGGAIRSTNIR